MSPRAASRLAGALLLILAGFWGGFLVYRSSNTPRHAGGAAAAIRVPVGESSAPNPVDAAGGDADFPEGPGPQFTSIPPQLPAFSLKDLDGKATPIERWRGNSLLINFWATWCAPCRREMPLLQSVRQRYHPSGFEVVGIAVDHAESVRKYADDLKIAYPLLVGEEDALAAARSLGMNTPVFPFTVFTGRAGEVVALYVGELHPRQADLILAVVERLNERRVGLREAQRLIATGLQALGKAGGE